MTLDNKTLALIAVGASIAANCQPCLESNISTALRCGAGKEQIADAIGVGMRVRRGAASKMDRFVSNLEGSTASSTTLLDEGCGCGSLKKTQEVKNG
jgi:AhpD family alkylhydroperoxidase